MRKDKHFIDLLRKAGTDVDEIVLTRHMGAYLNDFDSTDLLPKITAPSLVIAGMNDPLFPVEEQKFIERSIKNARLAIIDDCAHFITFEQPQALSALLRYWLLYF